MIGQSCDPEESIYNETTLTLEYNVNKSIDEFVFPEGIRHLIFSYIFNQPITKTLPSTLESIKFDMGRFNRRITKNILPDNLELLLLGDNHNCVIKPNVLPKNLKTLYLGESYNYEITHDIFPPNLEFLHVGHKYNYKLLSNSLPSKLIQLVLGIEYDQEITENVLPNTLEILTLDSAYSHIFNENVLPKSLHTLEIYGSKKNELTVNNLLFYQNIINIKIFKLDLELLNLPSSVKKIMIVDDKSYTVKNKHLIKILEGCIIVDENNEIIHPI